ncbi:MAG: type 4a pilus biogenesis protein PilO [bacterium]
MTAPLKKYTRRFSHLLLTRFRLVATGVVLFILAIGFFLFLNPKISQVRQTGIFDLQQTKDQLTIKKEILAATQDLKQRYDQLNLADVKKLRQILPDKQGIPDLFVQVEAIAQAAGLTLQNAGFTDIGAAATTPTIPAVSTEESETATANKNSNKTSTAPESVILPKQKTLSLRKMNVSFSVAGGTGYDDLKRFLANVESSVRLFDIQQVSYTPTGTESYQINAVTYYLQ